MTHNKPSIQYIKGAFCDPDIGQRVKVILDRVQWVEGTFAGFFESKKILKNDTNIVWGYEVRQHVQQPSFPKYVAVVHVEGLRVYSAREDLRVLDPTEKQLSIYRELLSIQRKARANYKASMNPTERNRYKC